MATYTLNSLLKSTQKLASWRGPGYANAEGLYFVECIPFEGMRSVVYKWNAKPSPLKRNKDGSLPKEKKPSFYTVYVECRDVNFANEGDEIPSDDTWSMIEYKGQKFYFEKPRIDINPIRIRCSCADFRFRGEYPAHKNGILYGGRYKSYQRKTPRPPEGRPFANPGNHPMLCKHIYAVATRSITEGWILGGSS